MPGINKYQQFELDILKDVAAFCDSNHIHYRISYGTLLGAVRHKGFIPWDNDIDIVMPIEDYRRFTKIAKKGLPGRYFLQNYSTDPCYNDLFSKVRVNGTTSLPIIWRKLNIHWGMGIDIFPVVGIYKIPFLARLQEKLFQLCRALISKDIALATGDASYKKSIYLRLVFLLPRSVRHFLCRIIERMALKKTKNSDTVSVVWVNLKDRFESQRLADTTTLLFEDCFFTASKDYDYELTVCYGDYMTPPPESERNGHEGTLGKIIYDLERDYTFYQGIIN